MRASPVLPAFLVLGACASLRPATLRLEPGASLRQAVFVVDSVRYEGVDPRGRAVAAAIGAALTEQLARRGHLASDSAAGQRTVVLRALLASYERGNLAVQLVFGEGTSPSNCVVRVTLADRDSGRMVGEMVTTQSSGGRLTTPSKCAYAIADAIDVATNAR